MALSFPKAFQVMELKKVATHLALTDNGDTLAVGLAAGDRKKPFVETYATDTGRLRDSYFHDAHTARGVMFTPNGDLYCLIDDQKEIVLYLREAGSTEMARVTSFPSSEIINAIGGDRNDNYVAVAGRTLHVLARADHRIVKSYSPTERLKTMTFAFSADGQSMFLYGLIKGQLIKVETLSGKELGRWAAPGDYGEGISTSRSGSYLAARASFGKGVFAYDLRTGARVSPTKLNEATVGGNPLFVQDVLVIAPPVAVDLANGKRILMPTSPPGRSVSTACAADAPVIAFANRDGQVMWGRLV